jgi:hypothetical protein
MECLFAKGPSRSRRQRLLRGVTPRPGTGWPRERPWLVCATACDISLLGRGTTPRVQATRAAGATHPWLRWRPACRRRCVIMTSCLAVGMARVRARRGEGAQLLPAAPRRVLQQHAGTHQRGCHRRFSDASPPRATGSQRNGLLTVRRRTRRHRWTVAGVGALREPGWPPGSGGDRRGCRLMAGAAPELEQVVVAAQQPPLASQAARPRRRNRRAPCWSLSWPNTGSTVCLRLA